MDSGFPILPMGYLFGRLGLPGYSFAWLVHTPKTPPTSPDSAGWIDGRVDRNIPSPGHRIWIGGPSRSLRTHKRILRAMIFMVPYMAGRKQDSLKP